MKSKSARSLNTVAYKAGLEVGEALSELHPEVVFLHSSVHYAGHFQELFEGLLDGLENPSAILFGCTGDGIYETQGVSHHGVCAMGFHSGGQIQWTVAVRSPAGDDPVTASRACAAELLQNAGAPLSFAWIFTDGKTDGSGVAQGVGEMLTCPFMGGLAADDRKFTHSYVFVNGQALENAIIMLGASGPLGFAVHTASGWTPVGQLGVIDCVQGNTIQRIDGKSAVTFLYEQLGKVPGETELGMIPLAVNRPGDENHYFLRAPSNFNAETGAATMFGSMEAGAEVRVCTASRDALLGGVDEAIAEIQKAQLQPCAALVVSCAGRKWQMEERWPEEVEKLRQAFGADFPLIGFPSFGEIGPFRKADGSYSASYFHNLTFVICIIGSNA